MEVQQSWFCLQPETKGQSKSDPREVLSPGIMAKIVDDRVEHWRLPAGHAVRKKPIQELRSQETIPGFSWFSLGSWVILCVWGRQVGSRSAGQAQEIWGGGFGALATHCLAEPHKRSHVSLHEGFCHIITSTTFGLT